LDNILLYLIKHNFLLTPSKKKNNEMTQHLNGRAWPVFNYENDKSRTYLIKELK